MKDYFMAKNIFVAEVTFKQTMLMILLFIQLEKITPQSETFFLKNVYLYKNAFMTITWF